MDKNNIYIGFDSKEPIASEVCEYSLKKKFERVFECKSFKIRGFEKKRYIQKRS